MRRLRLAGWVLLMAGAATRAAATPVRLHPDSLGRLQGVVYDSLRKRPLAEVAIELPDLSRLVESDRLGRFRFDNLPPGQWLVRVADPAADSLGVRAYLDRVVEIEPGRTTLVTLGYPSLAQFESQLCAAPLAKGEGIVFGTVREAERDRLLAGVPVLVSWLELSRLRAGVLRPQFRHEQVVTNAAGLYAICGVEADGYLTVQTEFGRLRTAEVEVEPSDRRVMRRDLRLSLDTASVALATDGVRLAEIDSIVATLPDSVRDDARAALREGPRRGRAQLRGRVVDAATRRPVPDARVSVEGNDHEAIADREGRFVLTRLPAGTQHVDVRRLGFGPLRLARDLGAVAEDTITIELGRPVRLDPLVVIAGQRAAERRVFEERRRLGIGRFLTGPQLARVGGQQVLLALRGWAPLWVDLNQGLPVVQFRTAGSVCSPVLWLDGFRADGAILQPMLADEFAAVEIYPRPSNVPSQYLTLDGCGAVLFWTKRRMSP